MKRLITLLLAMVMALSLVVPAWAENPDTLTPDAGNPATTGPHPVTVTVNDADDAYSVTVSWESLDFVYQWGDWSASDHNYSDANWKTVVGRNNATSAVVTVENHSNAPIWYSAALGTDGETGTVAGVSVVLNNSNDPIGLTKVSECGITPAGEEKTIAPKGTFTVDVQGIPTEHKFDTTIVNKLTVTISTSNP